LTGKSFEGYNEAFLKSRRFLKKGGSIMTKADLIQEVTERTGLPKKDVAIVINTLFDTMKAAFLRKERIELRGFGIFAIKNRKPRIGRNPKTKEEVKIPERTVVIFKPSKIIKDNLH
jgi:nucleoid DNA-binding protein